MFMKCSTIYKLHLVWFVISNFIRINSGLFLNHHHHPHTIYYWGMQSACCEDEGSWPAATFSFGETQHQSTHCGNGRGWRTRTGSTRRVLGRAQCLRKWQDQSTSRCLWLCVRGHQRSEEGRCTMALIQSIFDFILFSFCRCISDEHIDFPTFETWEHIHLT